jgi:predicted metal-binding transcription factor (methanogenesis marker protein 9)
MIRIHNTETNEIIDREMNDDEFVQWKKDAADAEAKKQGEAQAQARRQVLLEKLGITEDEARLLLGGN